MVIRLQGLGEAKVLIAVYKETTGKDEPWVAWLSVRPVFSRPGLSSRSDVISPFCRLQSQGDAGGIGEGRAERLGTGPPGLVGPC